MAKCSKTNGAIAMEPSLMFTFGVLIFLCIMVAIDEFLSADKTLGEEWDFVTPNNRRRS